MSTTEDLLDLKIGAGGVVVLSAGEIDAIRKHIVDLARRRGQLAETARSERETRLAAERRLAARDEAFDTLDLSAAEEIARLRKDLAAALAENRGLRAGMTASGDQCRNLAAMLKAVQLRAGAAAPPSYRLVSPGVADFVADLAGAVQMLTAAADMGLRPPAATIAAVKRLADRAPALRAGLAGAAAGASS